MDYHLGIPIMFVEDKIFAMKRHGRYGRLYNWRLQPWGFEYRTLPSWLVDPEIANGCLYDAYAVGHEYLERRDRLQYRLFSEEEKLNYYSKFIYSYFKKYLSNIINDIKGLTLYKQYSDKIDPFLKRVENEERWSDTWDVWYKWFEPYYVDQIKKIIRAKQRNRITGWMI